MAPAHENQIADDAMKSQFAPHFFQRGCNIEWRIDGYEEGFINIIIMIIAAFYNNTNTYATQ